MGAVRAHHAALWLCVDNSSESDRETRRLEQACSKDRCHRPGISRLVRHLRIVHSFTPIDSAASNISGQRSAENMSLDDGLPIRKHRDRVSPLSRTPLPLREKMSLPCLRMAENDPVSAFQQRVMIRMKALRAWKRLTQKQVSESIQVPLDTYKKWETRSGLPPEYIERYARAMGVTIAFVISGRDDDVDTPPEAVKAKAPAPKIRKIKTPKKKRKARAA